MPECVTTRAPAGPLCWTDSTISSEPSNSTSAPASDAVAMMSMSLTESPQRRAEPATSTWSEAGMLAQRGRDLLGDRERP